MGFYVDNKLGLKVSKENVQVNNENVIDVGWPDHLFVVFYKNNSFDFAKQFCKEYANVREKYNECVEEYGEQEMYMFQKNFYSTDMSESQNLDEEPTTLLKLLEESVLYVNQYKAFKREHEQKQRIAHENHQQEVRSFYTFLAFGVGLLVVVGTFVAKTF